jgi:hypothetical protein
MYKGWAIKLALALRPLMIYCASPLTTAMIITVAALRIVLAHGSKPKKQRKFKYINIRIIILNNTFYIYLHACTTAQVSIIKLTRAPLHTNRDEPNQTKALG